VLTDSTLLGDYIIDEITNHGIFAIRVFHTRLAADDIFGNLIQNYINNANELKLLTYEHVMEYLSEMLISMESLIENGSISETLTQLG
jgi:hypothetical protein